MAAAAYDSDLTSTNSGEIAVGNTSTDTGTWDESNNASWDDAGVPGDETNFYINYTNCISAQFTKTGTGTILYDDGSTHAVDTDGAVLIWYFWASPASLNDYDDATQAGIQFCYGSGIGAFYAHDCGGANVEPNPLGGWYCYALDPAAISTPSNTVGSPGSAPYDTFGIATTATAQARGYPSAVNAIRVGRCTLEATNGDLSNGYATFSGMEGFDTSTNARYGLFQNVYGAYRWQGKMMLGTGATSVDFRDSNVTINVANTPNVSANFNLIEVNNASSNVEWSNIIMAAPGVNDTTMTTASRGDFDMNAQCDLVFDGCSFTDMGWFTFDKAAAKTVDIDNSTFRRCNLITAGGASFDGCVFDETNDATKAVIVDSVADAGLIQNSTFSSSGTKHGLQIGDGTTVLSTTSVTLTNLTFTGYDTANPGTAANKAIWVNSGSGGGTITLNISGGSGVSLAQHVRATNCTVVVSADVTMTFTGLKDNTEVRVYKTSDDSVVGGTENATSGTTDNRSFSFSAPASTNVYYMIINKTYQIIRKEGYVVPSTNGDIPISQLIDRNYENP